MSSLTNESELIAKVLISNDQQAFSQLVKHYQSPLRQYCRRLSAPDHSLADDIAQETFIQAYRKLNLYAGKAKFQSWLFRIAYFQFLQHLRKTKVYDELDGDAAYISPDLLGADKRDIESAMVKLKASERACITLQYSFGYTHEEISEILDVPTGTIKSHIKRGKEKLSALLNVQSDTNTLTGVA
ncbi:RNA polymerase sigma factor [Colwelliaceae bacterium 6471]